jgi:hypothetical protein
MKLKCLVNLAVVIIKWHKSIIIKWLVKSIIKHPKWKDQLEQKKIKNGRIKVGTLVMESDGM